MSNSESTCKETSTEVSEVRESDDDTNGEDVDISDSLAVKEFHLVL